MRGSIRSGCGALAVHFASASLAVAVLCAPALHAVERTAALPEAIYVTNEAGGTLSVIDGRTLRVTRTLALGKRPRGLVVSRDGRRLYVALSGSPPAGPGVDESTLPPPDRTADGIGVVDLAQGRVVRMLRGVSDPEQLALGPDGKRLYVASEDSGRLFVFDLGSGQIVKRLQVGGEPEGVGVSDDGSRICATSEAKGTVALIDGRELRVQRIESVGQRPRNCRFSHDGTTLYVPAEVGATLSMIDLDRGGPPHTVPLAGAGVRPMGVALAPDGRSLYLTTGHAGLVLRLDARTGKVSGRVKVGDRPWGLAIAADGRRLYTADGPSNTVSVVALPEMSRLTSIAVGEKPWGVAVGPLQPPAAAVQSHHARRP
ncbi:cytochrome D1 domain-containing protein [Dyella sp. KRB-257]|uniref:cytochrome D1 domain-containing protein n=1 Tax=Dyella sp. KRB-257 TaxID=3400915 RepID=UPI003C092193